MVKKQQQQRVELDGTLPGPCVLQSSGTDIDLLRASIAKIETRLPAGAISERLSLLTIHGGV